MIRNNSFKTMFLIFTVAIILFSIGFFTSFSGCASSSGDDNSTATFTPTPQFTPTPTITLTPTPTPIPQDAYFPCYPGNTWDYFVDGPEQDGTGQAEVLFPINFGGYLTTPIQFTQTNVEDPSIAVAYLLSNTSFVNVVGGSMGEDSYSLDSPYNLLNFPLSVGNTWTSTTNITVQGVDVEISSQTTVVSVETINVQGVEYTSCFKLSSVITATATIVIPISMQIPMTMWLAPNVGPVKVFASIPDVGYLPELPAGDITIEITGTNF